MNTTARTAYPAVCGNITLASRWILLYHIYMINHPAQGETSLHRGESEAHITLTGRVLGSLDAALDRLYGSPYNPLYQSGAITVALIVLLIATGLYLLLFYRVGAPYASVAHLTGQRWLGSWVRSLHRFAADAAIVAASVHALRMFAQRRTWGRRTLPWVSGVLLLGLILVCGWTGYVMVWDVFGQLLATQGARILDTLPLFSEPLTRSFLGEQDIPGAFFFLNLFLHIALPIGLGIVLWLHVSRIARPVLLPPRRLMWWGLGVLTTLAVVWPVGMAPAASPFRMARDIPTDTFYAFWIPAAHSLAPGWTIASAALLILVLVLVPLWTRPRRELRPAPSVVDERLCTGCTQCALDCPWDAISMLTRTDGRDGLVAHVDPTACVSCGICAGSCAPMGVGPPGRTGRDQLARARDFAAARAPGPRDVVVIACARGAGGITQGGTFGGMPVIPVECAGNLHSSVVEYLVRTGAGGVLVAACPARDCWNREGAIWTKARLFHDREAELQARVDRRRVALVHAPAGDGGEVASALAALSARVAALVPPAPEDSVDVAADCDAPESDLAPTPTR